MSGNPVGWFEIYVTDMNRARAFYEAVFDFKLEKTDSTASAITEMWTLPMQREAAGAAGALVKMPGGPEGGGASTIVYFTCDDCALEAARVTKHGGSVMKQKVSIGPHGFIALVRDTEGNVIGLHSRK
jgi:predicted enzyme related to lactoylglutathione lyase